MPKQMSKKPLISPASIRIFITGLFIFFILLSLSNLHNGFTFAHAHVARVTPASESGSGGFTKESVVPLPHSEESSTMIIKKTAIDSDSKSPSNGNVSVNKSEQELEKDLKLELERVELENVELSNKVLKKQAMLDSLNDSLNQAPESQSQSSLVPVPPVSAHALERDSLQPSTNTLALPRVQSDFNSDGDGFKKEIKRERDPVNVNVRDNSNRDNNNYDRRGTPSREKNAFEPAEKITSPRQFTNTENENENDTVFTKSSIESQRPSTVLALKESSSSNAKD